MSIRLVAGANSGSQHIHDSHDKVGFNIIDGRVEHALLLEVLTDAGVGTLITAK